MTPPIPLIAPSDDPSEVARRRARQLADMEEASAATMENLRRMSLVSQLEADAVLSAPAEGSFPARLPAASLFIRASKGLRDLIALENKVAAAAPAQPAGTAGEELWAEAEEDRVGYGPDQTPPWAEGWGPHPGEAELRRRIDRGKEQERRRRAGEPPLPPEIWSRAPEPDAA